jgi:hypothetical protein
MRGTFSNLSELETFINDVKSDMKAINDFHAINGMAMNMNKTKIMFFHLPSSKLCLPNYVTLEDGSKLQRVYSHTYLGLEFDERLTMTRQINKIVKRITPTVNALSRLKWFLPTSVLLKIYCKDRKAVYRNPAFRRSFSHSPL